MSGIETVTVPGNGAADILNAFSFAGEPLFMFALMALDREDVEFELGAPPDSTAPHSVRRVGEWPLHRRPAGAALEIRVEAVALPPEHRERSRDVAGRVELERAVLKNPGESDDGGSCGRHSGRPPFPVGRSSGSRSRDDRG